jgi:hypothetical protein
VAVAATGREQVVEEVPSVGKGFKIGFFLSVAVVFSNAVP